MTYSPKLSVLLLAALLLSGCTNMWEGLKKDYEALDNSAKGYNDVNRETGYSQPLSQPPEFRLRPPAQQSQPRHATVQRIVIDDDGRVRVERGPNVPQAKPAAVAKNPVTIFSIPDRARPLQAVPTGSGRRLSDVEPLSPEMAASYGILNNQNVTVYPLDGDYMGYDAGYDVEGPGYQIVSGSGVSTQPYRSPVYGGHGAAETIYFKHNSARLGSLDLKKIKAIANEALGLSGGVTVIGHASTRAPAHLSPAQRALANLTVSMKRATAVSGALYEAGVTPDWVETIAKGDTQSTGDEAKDRRVDLYLGSSRP